MPKEPPAAQEAPWREPTQERSRLRVERMVAVAKERVAEHGLDGLTMQHVAEGADVPIGSLYQFFPDRNALLARIFADLLADVDEMVRERFRDVSSVGEFEAAARGLIEAIYRALTEDPALVEVWRAVSASRRLRGLDLEDTKRNANVLFEAARSIASSSVSDARLHSACFLVCDLVGSVAQTALEQPDDGEALVREYATMAQCYLRSLLSG